MNSISQFNEDEKIIVLEIFYGDHAHIILISKINMLDNSYKYIADNIYVFYLKDLTPACSDLFVIIKIFKHKFLGKIPKDGYGFFFNNIQILSEINIHENEYYDLLYGIQVLY